MTNHNHHNSQPIPPSNPEHSAAVDKISEKMPRLKRASEHISEINNWSEIDGVSQVGQVIENLNADPLYIPNEHEQILLNYMDTVVDRNEYYAAIDTDKLLALASAQVSTNTEAMADLVGRHYTFHARQVNDTEDAVKGTRDKIAKGELTAEEGATEIAKRQNRGSMQKGNLLNAETWLQAVEEKNYEIDKQPTVAKDFMEAAARLEENKQKPADEQDPEAQQKYEDALNALYAQEKLNRAEKDVLRQVLEDENMKSYRNKNYSVPAKSGKSAKSAESAGEAEQNSDTSNTESQNENAASGAESESNDEANGNQNTAEGPAAKPETGRKGKSAEKPLSEAGQRVKDAALAAAAAQESKTSEKSKQTNQEHVAKNERAAELYVANCRSKIARIRAAGGEPSPEVMAEFQDAITHLSTYKLKSAFEDESLTTGERAALINSFTVKNYSEAAQESVKEMANTGFGRFMNTVRRNKGKIKAGAFVAGLVLTGGIGGAVAGLAIGAGLVAASKKEEKERKQQAENITQQDEVTIGGSKEYVNDESLHAIEAALAEAEKIADPKKRLAQMKLVAMAAANENLAQQFNERMKKSYNKVVLGSIATGAVVGAATYAVGNGALDFIQYQAFGGEGSIRQGLDHIFGYGPEGPLGYTPIPKPWYWSMFNIYTAAAATAGAAGLAYATQKKNAQANQGPRNAGGRQANNGRNLVNA